MIVFLVFYFPKLLSNDPTKKCHLTLWLTSQLPGRIFSPSDISKKMSRHFLLHFQIVMGSYRVFERKIWYFELFLWLGFWIVSFSIKLGVVLSSGNLCLINDLKIFDLIQPQQPQIKSVKIQSCFCSILVQIFFTVKNNYLEF